MNIFVSLIIACVFTLGMALLILGTASGLILILADSNRPPLAETLSRYIKLGVARLMNIISPAEPLKKLNFTRLQTNDNGTIDLLTVTRGETPSSATPDATPDPIPEKIKPKKSQSGASNEEVHTHQEPSTVVAVPRKKKISVSRHSIPAKKGEGISIQSQTHTASYDEILQDSPHKFYLYSKCHPSPSGELPSQADF